MAPRQMVNVRMAQAGVEQVDKMAEATGATRSDVLRALVAEALASKEARTATTKRLNAMRETL